MKDDRTSTIQPSKEVLLRRLRRGVIPWNFEGYKVLVVFQYPLGHWSFAPLNSEVHQRLQNNKEISPGVEAKQWEIVEL